MLSLVGNRFVFDLATAAWKQVEDLHINEYVDCLATCRLHRYSATRYSHVGVQQKLGILMMVCKKLP
jgi:hypothetical protein